MSAEDAEAFVDSVHASHDQVGPGTVVIFVDVRERTTSSGTLSLSDAVSNVTDDLPPNVRVIRALLHVADAMVVRVVPANELPPGMPATWHRYMDEAVVMNGCGAHSVLAGSGTCSLVPVFAYERKTTSDLVSSVMPGRGTVGSQPTTQRWLDQKARLSAFCSATGCLPALILEGYMEHAQTGRPLGIMQEKHAHAVLHAANRVDGLPFWNSAGIFDSARLVGTLRFPTPLGSIWAFYLIFGGFLIVSHTCSLFETQNWCKSSRSFRPVLFFSFLISPNLTDFAIPGPGRGPQGP